MSSETTYLVLDIETIPDRDLFTPPEPAAGVERPFPPLYACRPVVIGATLALGPSNRIGRMVAARHPK